MEMLNNFSMRERIILGMVLLLAVGSAFYTFEYEVQKKKITGLLSKKVNLDNQVASYQSAAGLIQPNMMDREIRLAQQEVVELQDQIALLKSRMSGDSVDVVRALQRVAQQNSAEFQSVNTEERKIIRGQFQYKQINIQIGMVSTYQGVIEFMRSLDAIPAILSVEDLALFRDPNLLPKVQANMTVRLFVL